MRRFVYLALLAASGAALAQPVTRAQFPGSAQIGREKRAVVIHVICAMAQGRVNNLAVALDIAQAERLKRVFDVAGFEGPGAASANMHLEATAPGTTASADLGSTGSFGSDGAPATSFTFEAALFAATRSMPAFQALQGVVRTLGGGPSQLTWRIENPKRGGPPIVAAASLTADAAAKLQAASKTCL